MVAIRKRNVNDIELLPHGSVSMHWHGSCAPTRMSTTVSKLPTRHLPPQCSGVALYDEGQALVLRPVTAGDPEATAEEDLPWLIHRHAKPVVVDLTAVEHFNSDFARWLLHLTKTLPANRLHVRNTSRSVRAGMRLLGFDRLVDLGQ